MLVRTGRSLSSRGVSSISRIFRDLMFMINAARGPRRLREMKSFQGLCSHVGEPQFR